MPESATTPDPPSPRKSQRRPRVRLWVVALALGLGAAVAWWPRLVPKRTVVSVPTGIIELHSDRAIDEQLVRVAEEAARRAHKAGLDIPKRQLVLLCQTRLCWRANAAPRWSRATTRILDGIIVLSPWVPLGPPPDSTESAPWWRPKYWMLPGSRHECSIRVLTHELAHVAHIRQRGRLQAWRSGAPEAEVFAARVARATALPDSALAHYECAGAEG